MIQDHPTSLAFSLKNQIDKGAETSGNCWMKTENMSQQASPSP